MNIVYINSFYAPDEVGGAEKSVRFLAESMVNQGHRATVICLGRESQRTTLNGVQVERLQISNIYDPLAGGQRPSWQKLVWHGLDSFNPVAAAKVGQLLDRLQPDVVHTNTLSGLSVAAWGQVKDRGIRLVHSLRDYYLLCPNTAMFKAGHPCAQRCTECSCLSLPKVRPTGLVDHVIGNSHFILNKHLAAGLFKQASHSVIYNAYAPKAMARPETAQQPLKLGYIGRLAPTKGIEVLLAALRQLSGASADVELLIAGEGDASYVEALKGAATGLPVTFLGKVTPEAFYSAVDWTVVPSVWDEPLARVIFESFCHGVPVIGSNKGGTPELVRDGENGYLYPAQDASALKEVIARCIGQKALWPDFSEEAKNMTAMFSPTKVAEAFMNTYVAKIESHEHS
jgi:glycosyltransferase involved in cell wall biosynthesis